MKILSLLVSPVLLILMSSSAHADIIVEPVPSFQFPFGIFFFMCCCLFLVLAVVVASVILLKKKSTSKKEATGK